MEAADARAVVLVEGVSDRCALLTLAARRGRDLDADGVAVVAMGGVTSIGRFLQQFGPHGLDRRLAGLYDAGEHHIVRHHLERAGLGNVLTDEAMERLGFFACAADLEDELIRAVGVDTVQHIIAAQGQLRSFRTFQQQPAQRARSRDAQLRRFMGTHSGRKRQYAALLVEALDLDHVPRPLDGVLAAV